MNGLTALMNQVRQRIRREKFFECQGINSLSSRLSVGLAGTTEMRYSPPERAKPKAEREWRRRVIRIWPIVIRPRVVIGIRPVVRAVAVMAVVAARTEVSGIRCGRRLNLRLRR